MKDPERNSVYYKGRRITFKLPPSWNVLSVAEPKQATVIDDVASALKKVIRGPLGTQSLRDLATHAKTAVVICDDQTRPTPARLLLSTILDELNRGGVADERITLVVGRGTHREPSDKEIEDKVGRETVRRISVDVHDPDNRGALSYLGLSSRGTPIWINKKVVEADLRIGIGNVAPHYFAGYGGGPKIILPGVSGRETIVKNHTMIMDPSTVQGRVDGNSVYADMLEIARKARLDMKIDLLLDAENKIIDVFAGEVEMTHRAGIEKLNSVYGFKSPGKADVVITSGHPLEESLIQSSKATMSASLVTKEGGTIILVSGCYGGPGHMLDETLEKRPEPEEVVRWIAEGKAAPSGGPVASRMRRILKTKKVIVVTDGIPKEKVESMAMSYSPTLEAAIEEVSRGMKKADVIVFPAGSSINPLP